MELLVLTTADNLFQVYATTRSQSKPITPIDLQKSIILWESSDQSTSDQCVYEQSFSCFSFLIPWSTFGHFTFFQTNATMQTIEILKLVSWAVGSEMKSLKILTSYFPVRTVPRDTKWSKIKESWLLCFSIFFHDVLRQSWLNWTVCWELRSC